MKYFNNNNIFKKYFLKKIKNLILSTLKNKEFFYCVLPGGRTLPKILSLMELINIDWSKVVFLLTDERCVPIGDKNRNDNAIYEFLKSSKSFRKNNFRLIPAELGPFKSSIKYAKIISNINDIDLAILGLGEDGHTASLFHGKFNYEDKRTVIPIYNAPKYPSKRVSLSFNKLLNCKEKIVIAFEDDKSDIINSINNGHSFLITKLKPKFWIIKK